MFINYITLMLINLVAGLTLLSAYVYVGLDDPTPKRWVSGFGVVGAIALVTGLHMIFTWPIPGSYNIAFGETSVLFGSLLVGTSLSLAMGWDLVSLGIFGFFAGLAAIVLGVRIIDLNLTKSPFLTGAGFVLVGLAGIFAAPTLHFRTNRLLRLVGAIVLLIAALIFAFIGVGAYWAHLANYVNWQPLPMR